VRARTFRVPFSKVAPDAVELEWGPEDYLVVRPLRSMAAGEYNALLAGFRDPAKETASDAENADFLLGILRTTVLEWHLTGEDGEAIAMPATWADVDALPVGLGAELFTFLFTYTGDTPDPTTAGAPS
jgi:hypothetical protein